MTSSLVAALDYAAHGFAVFPCLERSKAPACSRGFHDATTNPATLRRWFGSYHRYNLAIATGIISGLWVLDVDGGDGATALAELESEFGQLPPTLTVITAAGCHLWFRADRAMPCTVGRVGLGLDTRGDGGYVLAPPSLHPDGPHYRFGNDEALAIAPDWLIQRACYTPVTASPIKLIADRSPITSPTAYGRAALARECEGVARAPSGARNHALNRASFSLHQLVANGELDLADVRNGLIDAATANGLISTDGPRSVEKTIASGARAGLQHPRARPTPS
jgi:hypothetical protein